MVTDAPISALSPRESHLLAVFLSVQFDLVQLAAAEGLTHDELLAFASSAAVLARLDSLRRFSESSFTLRSIHFRQHAIDALASACKASTDPVETRRCASALLRGLSFPALNPRQPRPAANDLNPPPKPAASPKPPSANPAPTTPGHPAGHLVGHPAPHPTPSPASVQTADAAVGTGPPGPDINAMTEAEFRDHLLAIGAANLPKDEPQPLAVPSPQLSDRDVAEIFANALYALDLPGLLTIAHFLTHPASINNRPAPAFVEELVEILPNVEFHRVEVQECAAKVSDLAATYTLHIHTDSSVIPLTLELVVAQQCWRIARITCHHPDSS